MAEIEVCGIFKGYNGTEVLKDVSFKVESGDFVSIMGESGSGKSTLLNIIAGNLRPEKGSVKLCGVDVTSAPEKQLAGLRRTDMGYVFQFFNLIPTINVRDNILLPVRLNGQKPQTVQARFDELCDLLKITHILARYPDKLSGGEQQRVAIARALVHSPKVVLLDEPTGNLDSENTDAIMTLLKTLNSKYGVTVVQVTHSLQSTLYGNRVINIKDGEISETAPQSLK